MSLVNADRALVWARRWKALAKEYRGLCQGLHQMLDRGQLPPGPTLVDRIIATVARVTSYSHAIEQMGLALHEAHAILDDAGISRTAPTSTVFDCDETEALSLASRIRNLVFDRDEARAGDAHAFDSYEIALDIAISGIRDLGRGSITRTEAAERLITRIKSAVGGGS